jgi:hypothetical protein
MVQLLLRHTARADTKDKSSRSLLLYAAEGGYAEVV